MERLERRVKGLIVDSRGAGVLGGGGMKRGGWEASSVV